MALNQAGLISELTANFAAPAPSAAGCAQQWATAMSNYASGVIPASTTVSAAAAALVAPLTAAFSSPAAAPAMEIAFATFATSVGLGMVGYTPVPPASPVGFADQFSGPHPLTHADAAQQIAGIIHSWMTTGSATLIAPPNTVVPWS